mgnify:CR=1 FL=1
MFLEVVLSIPNYDALLIGWNSKSLLSNVPFHGGNSKYCLGEADRENMISNDGWIITDDGSAAPTIQFLTNQTGVGSYTLPVITGTNLTGNEAYYTGPNGTGTTYNSGDIINYTDYPTYPITLYIYDDVFSGCSAEESFELTIFTIPACTTLSNPLDGAIDVTISTNISWNATADATGYKLSVGTNSGGTDIINDLDVGNVLTFDLLSDLPDNTEIFITIVPYNAGADAVGCSEESFITEDIFLPPSCTTLSVPTNGENNVSILPSITWNSIAEATGYKLSVGTTSGNADILDNLDVGNVLSYNFSIELPENTEIFITIVPYNDDGDATGGCSEESFFTEIIPPLCTNLSSPLNGDSNISISTNLVWDAVSDATGYRLTVSTFSGGSDIVANLDVGNQVTYNFISDLPDASQIYVSIIPYDLNGDAVGCFEESFVTEKILTTPPKYFTPNNEVFIRN